MRDAWNQDFTFCNANFPRFTVYDESIQKRLVAGATVLTVFIVVLAIVATVLVLRTKNQDDLDKKTSNHLPIPVDYASNEGIARWIYKLDKKFRWFCGEILIEENIFCDFSDFDCLKFCHAIKFQCVKLLHLDTFNFEI